jgi:histidine phosphotransferase ChpT
MTPDAHLPDFGALVAQRLCHDLVNPLGAIGNGLELMAMTQAETPEMALMKDSLAQALGRIKLYRLAFGAAPEAALLTGPELASALEALGGSRPVRVMADLPVGLPRIEGRLLALMALCVETALAWGGQMRVQAEGTLRVTGEAPRLRLDAEPWAALAEGRMPAQPSPPMIQFALATAAAEAAGRPLAVETGEGRVRITA